MKRLCTICARGGSKGIKGKNLLPLNGVPLILHSLNHAKDTYLFDLIAVSSDSDDILQVASDWGCDFVVRRPSDLASDEPQLTINVVKKIATKMCLNFIIIFLELNTKLVNLYFFTNLN